jgi:3-deoxy-manno-octulosonate cytidylyltransferase (CMP-KDO synthetase)
MPEKLLSRRGNFKIEGAIVRMSPKVLGVIPARLKSTRFPEKIIHNIKGKPLIQWVWEKVQKATLLDDIVIATDSKKVLKVAEQFGGKAILTSETHRSGTDRIGEVIQKFPQFDIVINIQGDEPLIQGSLIDAVIEPLLKNEKADMSSAYRKIPKDDKKSLQNPNVVKVILNSENFALYFSRYSIPYERNPYPLNHFQHIGIYGYKKRVLQKLIALPPAPLEKAESLEQLRALYYGYNIYMIETDLILKGVDTLEDIREVENLL